MEKSLLRERVRVTLREQLLRQSDAAALARDEAIDEESRPQNKFDTRSQEAAYLAEGQSRVAADLAAALEGWRTLSLAAFPAGSPIALGAAVEIEHRGRPARYFLGPAAGGLEVEAEGEAWVIVTPTSPVGRMLLGRREGDLIRLPGSPAGSDSRIVRVW